MKTTSNTSLILSLSSVYVYFRQLIPNTSDEGEDVSDEEKAFKELQKTLHCIIASFVKNPQVVEPVSMKVNFSSSRKKDGKFWAPI